MGGARRTEQANDMEIVTRKLRAQAAGEDQKSENRPEEGKMKEDRKEGQRVYKKGGVYAERQDADGPISYEAGRQAWTRLEKGVDEGAMHEKGWRARTLAVVASLWVLEDEIVQVQAGADNGRQTGDRDRQFLGWQERSGEKQRKPGKRAV